MARIGRVLLTNDDGYDAPGMEVLRAVAAEVAEEVWVVAPRDDQSGTSHSVSLHHPVRLHRHGERDFAVEGTPTDCVVMALKHVMVDAPPDLVLSGVNRGANIADEVAYSGTASAAFAALVLGRRAIALSQAFRNRDVLRWQTGRTWGAGVVRALWAAPWPEDVCYNVNFPDVEPGEVTGLRATRQGGGSIVAMDVEQRSDRRGQSYFWLGFQRHPSEAGLPKDRDLGPDTDVGTLRERMVSVTPLRLDRTARERLTLLQSTLDDVSRPL
ncbi:MAG: 5'/3'-nucleotidase SurE [Rhodospirillales bacterium]